MLRSKTLHVSSSICCLFLAIGILAPAGALARQATLAQLDGGGKARISENYGRLPISFEANRVQADGEIRFLTQGNGFGLYLRATEATLMLRNGFSIANELFPRQLLPER